MIDLNLVTVEGLNGDKFLQSISVQIKKRQVADRLG